jgi:hypothetical protein
MGIVLVPATSDKPAAQLSFEVVVISKACCRHFQQSGISHAVGRFRGTFPQTALLPMLTF